MSIGSAVVSNALYFLLLVAAIFTLIANRKSAKASEDNADAARRLFELQRREYEAREAERRPNLQLFDVFSENDSGSAPWYMPLNVYLMNFGERPAKIVSATVEFGKAKADADIRTASCVRYHEVAYLKIIMEADFRDAIHDGMNDAAENWLMQELTVYVTYSETDGSNIRTEKFKTPFTQTRWDIDHGSVTLAVLRDGDAPHAGDKGRTIRGR